MMRLREVVRNGVNGGCKTAFLVYTAVIGANALEHIWDTPLMERTHSLEECAPMLLAMGASYCLAELTERSDDCGRVSL
jgi:hypothetical protein